MSSIKFKKIISFISLFIIYLCEIIIPPIYQFIIKDEYPNPCIGDIKYISLARALSACMYVLILQSIIIYYFLVNDCNKGKNYKQIAKIAFWDSLKMTTYLIMVELIFNNSPTYFGVDIVISYWIHSAIFWIIYYLSTSLCKSTS